MAMRVAGHVLFQPIAIGRPRRYGQAAIRDGIGPHAVRSNLRLRFVAAGSYLGFVGHQLIVLGEGFDLENFAWRGLFLKGLAHGGGELVPFHLSSRER